MKCDAFFLEAAVYGINQLYILNLLLYVKNMAHLFPYEYGTSTFEYIAPKMFIKLPNKLKSISNITLFKRKLKILFKENDR